MSTFSPRYLYHGASAFVPSITPGRHGADGELLCTTMSVNVARRYGPVITRMTLNDCRIATMTVKEWMGNQTSLKSLRDEGYAALRVAGQPDCFDFPVDMVVVLNAEAVAIDRALSPEEIRTLDDSLADSHEPACAGADGWEVWLADVGHP